MNIKKLKLAWQPNGTVAYEYLNVDMIMSIDIVNNHFLVTLMNSQEYIIAQDDPYISGLIAAADLA